MLGLHQLTGTRPARQGAGRLRPTEVQRHRDPEHEDAQQLEDVAEPPAELHVVQDQGADERRGEKREADDDEEVASPAREEKRVDRAHGQVGVEEKAEREEGERERATGLGHERDEIRDEHADCSEKRDGDQKQHLEDDQVTDALAAVHQRQRREDEDERADRQRRTAGEGDQAVPRDEHARGRQPVEREQRSHHGEGRAGEDGAGVIAAGTDDRQEHRGGGRRHGGEADAVEVDAVARMGMMASDDDERGGRESDAHGTGEQRRGRLCPKQRVHARCYRSRERPGLWSIVVRPGRIAPSRRCPASRRAPRAVPSIESSAMSLRKKSATVQSETTRSLRETRGSWNRWYVRVTNQPGKPCRRSRGRRPCPCSGRASPPGRASCSGKACARL